MKLKTLKEVARKCAADKLRLDQGDYSYEVFCGYLKQEAIKWIKHIQKIKDNGEELFLDEGCVWDVEDVGTSSAIVILKHFFNITAEDLK